MEEPKLISMSSGGTHEDEANAVRKQSSMEFSFD